MQMIRTTVVGGMLFLLPLVVLALILGKAFELSMMVAAPVDRIIPIERFAGVAFVNILAVILLLALCFVAGLVTRHSAIRSRVSLIDGMLVDLIPAYGFAKSMMRSAAQAESEAGQLDPVLVTFDDQSQIAFEVEREGDHVVVYMPGSPSPWSGATTIVKADRVSPVPIGSHEAARVIKLLGRGSLERLRRVPEKANNED